jgi:hypothetical protein
MPRQRTDSELVKEGRRSYHKALFAVMQFRREVQDIIRASIDERIGEIADALKLDKARLSKGLTPFANPNFGTSWTGSEASVGLKHPAGEWEARWGIYFYFWIGEGSGSCARASWWFRDLDRAAESQLPFLRANGVEMRRSEAWVSEPIGEAPDNLSTAVDRVLARWIEVWGHVGGIKQFLPTE